jgi:hypothetical protein
MESYDPQRWITVGELRGMGWPIPKSLPDEAMAPRDSMEIETLHRDLTGDEGGLYKMTFNVPLRCGKTVYIHKDGKFIATEESEETDGRGSSQTRSSSGSAGGDSEDGGPGDGPAGPDGTYGYC